MATLTQVFARGDFSTTPNTVIYEVPVNTDAVIITNIIIVNTALTSETFTILLDGVELFKDTPIEGKSTISMDLKQPLFASGGEVTGSASSTSVKIHMSGVWVI